MNQSRYWSGLLFKNLLRFHKTKKEYFRALGSKLISLARVRTVSSTYEIETLPRILRMLRPQQLRCFFSFIYETPSQPHPNASCKYIYILRSNRKYLSFFELRPGRSSARHFGKDDNKAGLKPKVGM
jgi:hypothetical protein